MDSKDRIRSDHPDLAVDAVRPTRCRRVDGDAPHPVRLRIDRGQPRGISPVPDPDETAAGRKARRASSRPEDSRDPASGRVDPRHRSGVETRCPGRAASEQHVEGACADLYALACARAERDPDDLAGSITRDPDGGRPHSDPARPASDNDTCLDPPALAVEAKQCSRLVHTDPQRSRPNGCPARRRSRLDDEGLRRDWRLGGAAPRCWSEQRSEYEKNEPGSHGFGIYSRAWIPVPQDA